MSPEDDRRSDESEGQPREESGEEPPPGERGGQGRRGRGQGGQGGGRGRRGRGRGRGQDQGQGQGPPPGQDQPQGQGPPPGQGQPQGPPQGQAPPVQQGPSAMDQIQSPEVMAEIKWVAATYAMIGAAAGIIGAAGGAIADPGISTGGGFGNVSINFAGPIVAAAVVSAMGMAGPVAAALLGLKIEDRMRERDDEIETRKVYLAAGVANGVGFAAMALIAGFLAAIGGGGALGPIFVAVILGGILVGLVGVGAVYARENFGTPVPARPAPPGAPGGPQGPPQGQQPPQGQGPPQGQQPPQGQGQQPPQSQGQGQQPPEGR